MPTVNPYKYVLYVDDDADDKEWVAEACKAVDAALVIQFVENGRVALEFLSQRHPEQFPSLIVLDLNMPELDGRQTLKKLKGDPFYKSIPVVIVTTSSNKIDREVCRQLGAALFLTKPDTHSEWQTVIRQFIPLIR